MREFKNKKLPIGKSKKKVKSRKQAIAIALKRGRLEKKLTKELKIYERPMSKRPIDHQIFVDKDGLKKGGVEIEMTKPNETQAVKVGGQKRMLPEKKRSAKWY